MEDNCIKIAQVSDLHLTSENCETSRGRYSNAMNVFSAISLSGQHDMIFITGDISDDYTENSYKQLLEMLKKLTCRVFVIPGNHDDVNLMNKIIPEKYLFSPETVTSFNTFDFLFVNTVVNGEIHGLLTDQDLSLLQNHLENSGNKKKCIIMHHNPIPLNRKIYDKYMLLNYQDFLRIICLYDNVKLVIFGHVHNDYTISYRQTLFSSAPATCYQIKKFESDIIIEEKYGYKNYFLFEKFIETNCICIK
ncbi:phosphodiesterase [Coxiella burnetii]|uniref:phosphodiesterase n=1 Tax=Coxiella burnetii TaxID=777 RepID=UPI000CCC6B74|nr:phosphodiesterase [Coxiella burnetii]PNT87805.1 phosphodiesterase [Coxiella burnetii]